MVVPQAAFLPLGCGEGGGMAGMCCAPAAPDWPRGMGSSAPTPILGLCQAGWMNKWPGVKETQAQSHFELGASVRCLEELGLWLKSCRGWLRVDGMGLR